MATDARTDYATPPGDLLAHELEARGLTQKDFAAQCKRPAKTINEIIKGKKAITSETALDFERVLGVSAEFWLRLEMQYRLALARTRLAEAAYHPARRNWSRSTMNVAAGAS